MEGRRERSREAREAGVQEKYGEEKGSQSKGDRRREVEKGGGRERRKWSHKPCLI